MTRPYLIRHGETEWNIANKYQGKTDIPLSPKGIQQAEQLSKRLQSVKIDAIYSSDLKRAYDTGMKIAQKKEMKVHCMARLREIDFGEWEGYTIEQLQKIYGESYNNFLLEPYNYPFPGEGSMETVRQRIDEVIQKILQNECGGSIAIVSHGGVLKVALLQLLDLHVSFYKRFWLGNTSLSIIDIKEQGAILSLLNDTSHLQ